MESFVISLNAVAPMFLMMLLGYLLKGAHFFTDETLRQINALVFRVLLPMQLFRSSYQTDLAQVVNGPFLLLNAGLVVVSFGLLALVSMRTVREPGKRGALLQAMFRGNTALVGLAIAQTLFGEEHMGTMAITVAVVVPIYNVLSVLALEMFQGGKLPVGRVLREIATNTIILGCLCGLAVNLAGLHLPVLAESTVDSLASAATPVALIALGYRGIELGTMAIIHAAPTAVSTFPMAQQMGGDADLAAAMVVFTGMFSCLTIFLCTFALLQLGLM